MRHINILGNMAPELSIQDKISNLSLCLAIVKSDLAAKKTPNIEIYPEALRKNIH